jgi:hypothetical protein
VTLGLIVANAVPLKETAMVPAPPAVAVGTIDENPNCGFEVTAQGSLENDGGGAVATTVKDSLLLVPSLLVTERV